MKKLSLLFFLFLSFQFSAYTQSITPSITDEVCVGNNITFSVTIGANSIQSVQPAALNVNPVVVQQPFNLSANGANITFNFIGRFTDNNNKQTFKIVYTNNAGQQATFDFTFPKIKSLLLATSFSQINPTPSSITAQLCQIENFNISFANVSYGNPFETPPIGYGTVANYEYLLPNGWKLGTQTSNGTTWLNSSNNVIITSDAGTGDGSGIRIRPSNIGCAPGLQPGREVILPISRPVNLTISGLKTLCTGSSTYTLTGLPANSTVSWSTNNPNTASVPNGNSGSTVELTKVSDGVIILTATVTLCNNQVITKDYQVAVGSFAFGTYYYSSNSSSGQSYIGPNNNHLVPKNQYMSFNPSIANTDITNPVWSIIGGTVVGYSSNGQSLSFSIQAPNTSYATRSTTFNLNANGPCGNFNQGFTYSVTANGAFRISATPNPSKGDVYVNLQNETKEELLLENNQTVIMNVYSNDYATIVKEFKFNSPQKNYHLTLQGLNNGLYIIEVIIGKDKQTTKIFIDK